MTHFNTTHESGETLKKFQVKSFSQEQLIFGLFKLHPDKKYTPSQVSIELYRELSGVPITSIRRAMTNLTYPGSLVKTNTKRPGPYGRPEYYWRLDNE